MVVVAPRDLLFGASLFGALQFGATQFGAVSIWRVTFRRGFGARLYNAYFGAGKREPHNLRTDK